MEKWGQQKPEDEILSSEERAQAELKKAADNTQKEIDRDREPGPIEQS